MDTGNAMSGSCSWVRPPRRGLSNENSPFSLLLHVGYSFREIGDGNSSALIRQLRKTIARTASCQVFGTRS